jgi:threonine/homoserine/homoserine lactone efflux protein
MLEWLGIIALFSIVACLSPGPNNIMLVLSAINFGLKRTLPRYSVFVFLGAKFRHTKVESSI